MKQEIRELLLATLGDRQRKLRATVVGSEISESEKVQIGGPPSRPTVWQ